MFACLGERRFFCLFIDGFLSFLLLEVLPFPLQLCLKPALDLLPFGFKEFLVARHIENRIESTVDSGRVLARGLAELGDIELHFILMRRRDGVPLERDTTSRSPLEEVFLFRQGTAAYPAPLLLQPVLDFLKAFV